MARIKLLIMGLPGAGKTTLAKHLAPLLHAVWFDGDDTRAIWPELGFAAEDRVEQARRMGALCDLMNAQGYNAVASFVCPTPEAREAFRASNVIWVDRIQEGRFADTNAMFVPPEGVLRLTTGSVDSWVDWTMGDLNEASLYLRATA